MSWIRRNWPALLAILLQAEGAWKLFKWALDWRGRYDALAATYHEVGGAHAMIGYAIDPPPLFYPLAFLAGFLLLWWNFKRQSSSGSETRAKVQTVGPWILILGGPIVGLVWLFFGADLTSKKETPTLPPSKFSWVWEPLTDVEIQKIADQLRVAGPHSIRLAYEFTIGEQLAASLRRAIEMGGWSHTSKGPRPSFYVPGIAGLFIEDLQMKSLASEELSD